MIVTHLCIRALILLGIVDLFLCASPALQTVTYLNTTCVTFIAQKIELLNSITGSNQILPVQQHTPATGGPCTATTTVMNLSYTNVPDVRTMTISITFSKIRQNWAVSGTSVNVECNSGATVCSTVTGGYLDLNWLSGSEGMSFKCSQPPVMKVRLADGIPSPLSLRITWLQVQPFGLPNGTFSKATDCVGLFTIPIWSGLVVSFLLIGILTYGLSMLAAVKPYELYDDPKSKMIQLGATN